MNTFYAILSMVLSVIMAHVTSAEFGFGKWFSGGLSGLLYLFIYACFTIIHIGRTHYGN